jgi:uncharacterized protein (DUF305 family)
MNLLNNTRRAALALCFMTLSAASVADDKMSGMGSDHSGELHAAMMKGMQDANSMKMSGDVDKDFAMMMTMHHEQAIAMAKVLQDHGRNAELKAMALKMSAQQQKEIQELKRFQ